MGDGTCRSVTQKNHGSIILNRAFSPLGSQLALTTKHLGLYPAHQAGTTPPCGEILRDRLAAAPKARRGGGDRSVIPQELRR